VRQLLMIPIVCYALWLLAAGAIIPLVLGIVARIFIFRPDKDDERNDPAKVRRLKEIRDAGPDTPELQPLVNEPWPEFSASSRRPPGLTAG
jgi:hypothetical protein